MQRTVKILAILLTLALAYEAYQITTEESKQTYNENHQKRNLQQAPTIGQFRVATLLISNIRIPQIVQPINQVSKVTSNFMLNFIKLPRLQTPLIFPDDNVKCGGIAIPISLADTVYKTGIHADLGVFVDIVINSVNSSILSCVSCVIMRETKRPVWGVANWNIMGLITYFQNGINAQEFQRLVRIAMHEFLHIIVFSRFLYDCFIGIDKPIIDEENPFKLKSVLFTDIARQHFNCNANFLWLEDSNNGSIHWEKYLVGEELMTQILTDRMYVGIFTIKLLMASGWYSEVNSQMLEQSVWGKNKGCSFMMKQSCNFEQFCPREGQELCNWDHTAIAKCRKDRLTNGCNTASQIVSSCLTKSIIDNHSIFTYEQYSPYSRCFKGDVRAVGSTHQSYHRCYRSHCVRIGHFQLIQVTILDKIYHCYYPLQKITITDPRVQGFLECPQNFDRICAVQLPICPQGCGTSGVCINGKCLCIGNQHLTQTCQN